MLLKPWRLTTSIILNCLKIAGASVHNNRHADRQGAGHGHRSAVILVELLFERKQRPATTKLVEGSFRQRRSDRSSNHGLLEVQEGQARPGSHRDAAICLREPRAGILLPAS